MKTAPKKIVLVCVRCLLIKPLFLARSSLHPKHAPSLHPTEIQHVWSQTLRQKNQDNRELIEASESNTNALVPVYDGTTSNTQAEKVRTTKLKQHNTKTKRGSETGTTSLTRSPYLAGRPVGLVATLECGYLYRWPWSLNPTVVVLCI